VKIETCKTLSFTKEPIEKLYGTKFTDSNEVRLLWKSEESFKVIFDAVSEARKFICLEFYIFRDDDTGTELANLLIRKAIEGVSVYVLYDHFGSFETSRKFWRKMKDAGIHVQASHPFKWASPLKYVHRNHKKIIIVDGDKTFTGGLNIANEYRGYYFRKHKRAWRDTGIILEGPIVNVFFDEFKKSWAVWGGKQIANETACKLKAGRFSVFPVFASSSKGRKKLRSLLYYSINASKTRICLTTAYFTPSRKLISTLSDAVKRGVDVKLLLPSESDIPAAHYAGRASFARLLKAGIDIYNYEGNILHAKTSVFDDCWSIIGSANLDYQSLMWNDEGNVGILDEIFGKQMADIFNSDLQRSKKIDLLQWEKRGFFEKLKERFFSLFRKRL
jgi:cardiolipin synthase